MLAIRAAKAFDGERVLQDGATVLVDDGRIMGVEPAAFAVPDAVDVIDIAGGTVLPGLVNCHVHLCGDSGVGALERLAGFDPDHLQAVIDTSLADELAAGVCTVRDLGDQQWAVVDRRDRTPPATVGPHIVASGPPITSVRGHCWAMGGETAGVDAMRAAVRERAERRVDVVKVMASGGNTTPGTDIAACQFTLEELRAAVDEAHRLGLPITAHAHARAAVDQAIEAGVDGIEHCTCLGAGGVDFSPQLMSLLAEREIVVCPTLGRAPGAMPPPQVLEMQARFGITYEGRLSDVAAAHRAGVHLVSGDDSGIGPAKRHGVYPESVIDLHAGGVPVRDVLASATSAAAAACGVGDRKGRLAPGFDADILAVDGDLTADIAALRAVAMVIAGGAIALDNRP